MSAGSPLWIEMAIIVPLIGALLVGRAPDSKVARSWSVIISAIVLTLVVGAWLPFDSLSANEPETGSIASKVAGRNLFVVDHFNGPLLSLIAVVFLVTITTTVQAKLSRFSFSRALASEAITLATFASHEPWLLIFWLTLGVLMPYGELKWRRQSTRVYAVHMLGAIGLLIVGQLLVDFNGGGERASTIASFCLLLGVLLRSAVAPAHCWVSDLFERTSFGSAMLFAVPMTGAYAATLLLLPVGAPWVAPALGAIALFSSVYASGMALVQHDARRFYSFLLLSQSGFVLAGLAMTSPIGLAGGLCVWISAGLSLAGLGLVLRGMEVRVGAFSLAQYHGLYDRVPLFGAFFLLAGLAMVGFPGTSGFLANEMLFDGALTTGVFGGVAVVVAGALNGIAILQAYFKIFTGGLSPGSIILRRRPREQFAIVTLAVLILGIGFLPSPLIVSRHRVAEELLEKRESTAMRASAEHSDARVARVRRPGAAGRIAREHR